MRQQANNPDQIGLAGATTMPGVDCSTSKAIPYDQRPAERIAAEEIIKQEKSLIRRHKGCLYRYRPDAGFWSPWSEVEIRSRAMSVLKCIYVVEEKDDGRLEFFYRWGSAAQARNAVAVIEAQVPAMPVEASRQVIVFGNGTYDISERALRPHSFKDYAMSGLGADFIELSDCPSELRRVIHTCYGLEAEPIIRACIRQLIDPSIPYGQAFHFLGRSGGGKGTLIEFLQSLFSRDLVTDLAHPAQIDNPDKLHQFVLGRQLVVFPDCPAHSPGRAGAGTFSTFYKLVENVPLTTRRLNSSESHTSPMGVRCIIGSTQPLSLGRDAKTGFARRVLTVRVRDVEGHSEQDPSLKDDLLRSMRAGQVRSEAASWALAMAEAEVLAVLAKKDPEGLLSDAAEDAEIAGDSVSQFADQCLIPHPLGPAAQISPADLAAIYEAYCGWCMHSNVGHPMQLSNFQGQLRQTLGGGRCLPRRKESRKDAKAAGRERQWLPALDAGFALIRGLLPESDLSRNRFNPAFIASGGLCAIRSQPPFERPKQTFNGPGQGQGGTGQGHPPGPGPEPLQNLGGPMGPELIHHLELCREEETDIGSHTFSLQESHQGVGPVPAQASAQPRSEKGFPGRTKRHGPVPASPVPRQQSLVLEVTPVGSGAEVFDGDDDPAWGLPPGDSED
jgi:phage/plasmid-associated DNA primase